MIPQDFEGAFLDRQAVRTPGGAGYTFRRRLADLVLPTGKILLGYPGSAAVNEPSPVRPVLPPGRCPVWVSLALTERGCLGVAFLLLQRTTDPPASWEEAGSFFTDSGTGCLMDESALGLFDQYRTSRADWFSELGAIKGGVLRGGDGNLVLDSVRGVNAILFRTFDWRYPCFVGRDGSGEPICLVVDGRTPGSASG